MRESVSQSVSQSVGNMVVFIYTSAYDLTDVCMPMDMTFFIARISLI